MTRLLSALILSLVLISTSGCAASHADIQRALDGLDTATDSLKVTGEIYEQFCVLQPASKICVGDLAAKIRTALALGPLTLGEIKALLINHG